MRHDQLYMTALSKNENLQKIVYISIKSYVQFSCNYKIKFLCHFFIIFIINRLSIMIKEKLLLIDKNDHNSKKNMIKTK